jgi:hypothetical protein
MDWIFVEPGTCWLEQRTALQSASLILGIVLSNLSTDNIFNFLH